MARSPYVMQNGQVVNATTGQVIAPGSTEWQPSWDAVLQVYKDQPANTHLDLSQWQPGATPPQTFQDYVNQGGVSARNDVPWYQDPALLGAIALPVGAAAAAYAGGASAGGAASGGAGAGAAGAGAAGAGGAGGGAAAAATGATLAGIPASTLFNTGASLFGNLFGAWLQGNAADSASSAQASAAKYAADLQAKAQADALQFSRQSGENAYQNSEASRQGNYGIWAAQQGRLGTLGQAVGMGPRQIPAYVPGVDPQFTSGGTLGSATNGAPALPTKDPLFSLAQKATQQGLRGQAAVDWINQQQPGAAVLVHAGQGSPAGKLVWYDKGTLPNGMPSGKFQVKDQWEYSDDPTSWQNGAPTGYRYVPLG